MIPTAATPMVAPLDAFGADDLPAVGGKAANLGELLRAGLPVPPGFVVTTDAYAAAVDGAGLADLLAGPDPDPAALRAAVGSAPVPEAVRAAITEAHARLGGVPVAVRSSATAEDLPGAAFAGQQDTYLNVVGADGVVDAVRRCWASLWTDRAAAYRRARSVDPAGVRIAVVVQAMVESEAAGVMFTADPVSGERGRIVVESGRGLGEAVVSGLVTPDHYALDRRGRVLEHRPGRAEVVVRPVPGGGIVHERPGEGGGRSPLPDGVLRELAGYGRAAAEHFGRPQDMEWALAAGRVHIVQSRPMTALPPESVPLNRRQRLMATVLSEYVPVRPYPMDVDTWLGRGPSAMMRDIAHEYGIVGAFDGFLREEDGVVVELVPPAPHPVPRALLTPFRLVRKARTRRITAWREDPRFLDFLRRVEELDARDPAALAWPELLAVPEEAIGLLDPCRELRLDYLPGAAVSLARLTATLALLGRRALLGDLTGGAHTRTEDANRALQDLAGLVRGDAGLRGLFAEASPEEVLARVRAGRVGAGTGFAEALEVFLREFGRRETASPLLVSPPTLGEVPESVIGLVRVMVDEPRAEDPGSCSERALAALLEHPLLRGRRARARMTRWVRAAQYGVAFREDTHFFFTAPLPALRRALLEMGRRLTRAGVLGAEAEVFHLRMAEVAQVADPGAVPAETADRLRSLVRARAARREELTGVRLLDLARVYPRRSGGDALATGSPAGSGRATGTVRVVRGPDDFHRLGAGEILVCPTTNPSWTPLFRRAAAVVADTGSMGSHAAIVAREYGIPAVMGTGNGTSVLADGARVTVDGDTGLVTEAS
ncbi:PEP/pyruvate-binding domain-containing protein [Nocardiopsis protaetiae]|uniref:PEP/pyruvate-binding domain-containing protein n=1 Tax=Nocardiopsis protaetiae TaxID=3382270 RepID=UPI00387B7886